MTTERARTLSAQAVDEIASSYTLLKRILSELEETLVLLSSSSLHLIFISHHPSPPPAPLPPCLPLQALLTEYAQWIQRKHLVTSSNGSIDSDEAIGLFDDDMLEDSPHPEAEVVGTNNAGGMASGWRREMHEVECFLSLSFAVPPSSRLDRSSPIICTSSRSLAEWTSTQRVWQSDSPLISRLTRVGSST
jgi:hypothetical protein